MSIIKRLNKVICLVLIICIMCCAAVGDTFILKAHAFAITATTTAVICCILMACGIVANNSDDLIAAADSFKYWLDSKIASSSGETYQANISDINAMASAWVGGAPMVVNGSLKNSLREWADDNGYQSGSNLLNFNSDTLSFSTLVSGQVFFEFNTINIPTVPYVFSLSNMGKHLFNGLYICLCYGNLYHTYIDSNGKASISAFAPNFSSVGNGNLKYYASSDGLFVLCPSGLRYNLHDFPFNVSFDDSVATSNVSTIDVVPEFFPTSTSNTGTTVVTPDWPVTTSADGTKSVSIPSTLPNIETIPAVGTASGSLTSTGEGTGIFEGVGSMVLDIPIVGTIAQALANIYSLLTNFFNFDGFELDFKPLKLNMLPKVFPFCIPFDFVNLVKMFSADSTAFVFKINYSNQYFTINHTVDLTPFRIPILFFRYVVVAWFSYILISKTRTLIKW